MWLCPYARLVVLLHGLQELRGGGEVNGAVVQCDEQAAKRAGLNLQWGEEAERRRGGGRDGEVREEEARGERAHRTTKAACTSKVTSRVPAEPYLGRDAMIRFFWS